MNNVYILFIRRLSIMIYKNIIIDIIDVIGRYIFSFLLFLMGIPKGIFHSGCFLLL